MAGRSPTTKKKSAKARKASKGDRVGAKPGETTAKKKPAPGASRGERPARAPVAKPVKQVDVGWTAAVARSKAKAEAKAPAVDVGWAAAAARAKATAADKRYQAARLLAEADELEAAEERAREALAAEERRLAAPPWEPPKKPAKKPKKPPARKLGSEGGAPPRPPRIPSPRSDAPSRPTTPLHPGHAWYFDKRRNQWRQRETYAERIRRLVDKMGYTKSVARGHARKKEGEMGIAYARQLAQAIPSVSNIVERHALRLALLGYFRMEQFAPTWKFMGPVITKTDPDEPAGYLKGPRDWHEKRELYKKIAVYFEHYFGVERHMTFTILFGS